VSPAKARFRAYPGHAPPLGLGVSSILNVSSVSGAYTLGDGDDVIIVDTSSSVATQTLPNPGSAAKKIIWFQVQGTSNVTTGNSAPLVTPAGKIWQGSNGSTVWNMAGIGTTLALFPDGTNWDALYVG
jgi:hypothetical protein